MEKVFINLILSVLTLSLTAVGPFGHTPLEIQITLKVLNILYKTVVDRGGGGRSPKVNRGVTFLVTKVTLGSVKQRSDGWFENTLFS